MKLAFFHELPEGGARIAVNEIAKQLPKNSEIDLYYTDKSQNPSEHKNYHKVHFFKFTPKNWSGGNPTARIYKDTVELKKLSILHKKMAKIIDSKNYDLVFVSASKFVEAPFILKHLKTKKIFYLHDPHFRVVYEDALSIPDELGLIRKKYESLHRKVLKVLDRQNIKNADLLLANSKYTKKTTEHTYGIDAKVAYLGVDTHFFKPASLIKKKYDVLYIGSKDILDGYDILEKSFNYLANINVKYVFKEKEWVTQERMRDLYRESKIVICLGLNEPLGLIPLEAAACGVVTIALDQGGYKETVIDGKTGYLVKNKPKEIAGKIKSLLNDEVRLRQVGGFARKNTVAKWDWKVRIEEFVKIFKEVKTYV